MFTQALSGVGVKVTDAVVLLDREQGGADCLKAKGVNLHRYVTWKMECDAWCQGLVLVEFCKTPLRTPVCSALAVIIDGWCQGLVLVEFFKTPLRTPVCSALVVIIDVWCQVLVLLDFCKTHLELWCVLCWLSVIIVYMVRGVRFLCW